MTRSQVCKNPWSYLCHVQVRDGLTLGAPGPSTCTADEALGWKAIGPPYWDSNGSSQMSTSQCLPHLSHVKYTFSHMDYAIRFNQPSVRAGITAQLPAGVSCA